MFNNETNDGYYLSKVEKYIVLFVSFACRYKQASQLTPFIILSFSFLSFFLEKKRNKKFKKE
jgi:hypothetical protein